MYDWTFLQGGFCNQWKSYWFIPAALSIFRGIIKALTRELINFSLDRVCCDMTPESRNSLLLGNGSVNYPLWSDQSLFEINYHPWMESFSKI
jgi:hypothetical protein